MAKHTIYGQRIPNQLEAPIYPVDLNSNILLGVTLLRILGKEVAFNVSSTASIEFVG